MSDMDLILLSSMAVVVVGLTGLGILLNRVKRPERPEPKGKRGRPKGRRG